MKRKYLIERVIITAIILAIGFGGIVFAQDKTDDAERVIRKLYILTRPQATSPDEYETALLIAEGMRELGLDADAKVITWEQMIDAVWYNRDSWDMTGWQMTARPERLDPDEFLFNLFHSSTTEGGYNFIGYNNPEYDKIAEQQRITMDREKRRELVYKLQEILANDVAANFVVHPMVNIVYNNNVFKTESIKEMAGMGIKNFWTYIYAEPAGEQKNFILNSNDTIHAINPLFVSGTADSWVTELIWDRLMRVGEDGLPKPWAAESVEWVSDTQVKIVLRKNMKWHDGNPVTAEDVKFSFEAPLSGEVPAYKPFVDNIESIEVLNDHTLTFNLKKASAAFEISSLAKLNIIPKHIWQPILDELLNSPDNVESFQEDVPIGSGPYKFSSWKFSEEVVLVGNKDHFASPKMEKWIVRFIPNMEAALGMIQNGEINFLSTYLGDSQLLQQIVDSNSILTMVSSVDLGFHYFTFNHRRPPFDDVAFRRAICALTERDVIVAAIWKGFAVPGDSVVSPALEYWKNDNLNFPSGGLAKAKSILQEANYELNKKGQLMYPEGKIEELNN
jgi:peptide/nickel transport system substrate-binding protein